MEEYLTATDVGAYTDPWRQAPVGIMDPGRETEVVAYTYTWL